MGEWPIALLLQLPLGYLFTFGPLDWVASLLHREVSTPLVTPSLRLGLFPNYSCYSEYLPPALQAPRSGGVSISVGKCQRHLLRLSAGGVSFPPSRLQSRITSYYLELAQS